MTWRYYPWRRHVTLTLFGRDWKTITDGTHRHGRRTR